MISGQHVRIRRDGSAKSGGLECRHAGSYRRAIQGFAGVVAKFHRERRKLAAKRCESRACHAEERAVDGFNRPDLGTRAATEVVDPASANVLQIVVMAVD